MDISPNKRSPEKGPNFESPKKFKICDKSEKEKMEEASFCALYERIIDQYLNENKVQEEEINSALEDIKRSFYYEQGNTFMDINYNKVKYACGYLYRYAPHGTGLTRLYAFKAFRECDDFRDLINEKKHLKILSLGGGPGSDMIGFCSAMYDVLTPDSIEDYTFDMRIIDCFKRWASCIYLAEYLLIEEDLGDAAKLFRSKCCINMSFLHHDLKQSSLKYENTLKYGDIIIIARLMSILDWPTKRKLPQDLQRCIKQHALILYIDTTFDEDLWTGFEILYRSPKEPYTLSLERERFGFSGNFSSEPQIVIMRRCS